MRAIIAAALVGLIGASTTAAAQEHYPYNLEGRAHIMNVDVEKCWLTQTYEKTVAHFLKGGLKADVHTSCRLGHPSSSCSLHSASPRTLIHSST